MRYPAVAGRFYPSEKNELKASIENCFKHDIGPGMPDHIGTERNIVGAVVPHAGYMASGMNAAHVYKRIVEDGLPEAYIVIGPDHHGMPFEVAMCSEGYMTPFGPCMTHNEIATELSELILDSCESHKYEHSVEVQIPFIQFIDPDPKVVPIIMRDQSQDAAQRLSVAIREVCKDRDVVVIASSDLAHYVPKDHAERVNTLVLNRIADKDVDGMYSTISENDVSVCGYGPIAASILSADPSRIEILKYSDSWDSLRYDRFSVVGYGSAVMLK